MATVLDITSKLQKEEKVLKIGEQEFHIDDTKNAVMKATAAIESTEEGGTAGFSAIDKALEFLIGKEGVEKLDGMNLNFKGYQSVFIAVMSLVSGTSYEEAEQRFQNAGA
jgi:hypothetical protein